MTPRDGNAVRVADVLVEGDVLRVLRLEEHTGGVRMSIRSILQSIEKRESATAPLEIRVNRENRQVEMRLGRTRSLGNSYVTENPPRYKRTSQ